MEHWTVGGWLLTTAIVAIIALIVENDWKAAIGWGLGTLFLPVLLPLGFMYLVAASIFKTK